VDYVNLAIQSSALQRRSFVTSFAIINHWLENIFSYQDQLQVARACLRLLAPKPGSIIIGRQVGHLKAAVFPLGEGGISSVYMHDEASWKRLWDEVSRETGVQLKVDIEMVKHFSGVGPEGDNFENSGGRMMKFCVERL